MSFLNSLVNEKVAQLTTKNQDLHGRRIINAGDAMAPQDYVTLAQLDTAIASGQIPPSTPYIGVTRQSIVTPIRALGTVYRNNNPTAMFVNVVASIVAGASNVAYSDNLATPITTVSLIHNTTAVPLIFTFNFFVLPGNYYKVTGTALTAWVEWV